MIEKLFNIEAEIKDLFGEIYGIHRICCRCCGRIVYDIPTILKFLTLQKEFNATFIITSYYRCKDWNQKVGGTISSRHLLGKAIDFCTEKTNIQKIFDIAPRIGFTTILYYVDKNFFHIDTQPRAVYIDRERKWRK